MLARHVGLVSFVHLPLWNKLRIYVLYFSQAHRKLEEFATPEQLVWMKTGANNRGNNKQQQAASALQLASQAIALPTVPIPPSAAVIAGTSASPTTSTGLASRLTGTSVEQPMMTQQQLTKPPTAAAIAASKGMTLPRASCPTCGKQFPAGVSKRKAHLASSHANRALKAFVKSNKQCQLCSYTSSSIGIVARHVGIVHGKLEDFATAAGKNLYTCVLNEFYISVLYICRNELGARKMKQLNLQRQCRSLSPIKCSCCSYDEFKKLPLSNGMITLLTYLWGSTNAGTSVKSCLCNCQTREF